MEENRKQVPLVESRLRHNILEMPKEIRKASEALGHKFVCDGGRDFKMGEANGHFTYIEDPDGTLIEFVETFKIPIIKKLGIYLNLEKREDSKPLPAWILKCLRFIETK